MKPLQIAAKTGMKSMKPFANSSNIEDAERKNLANGSQNNDEEHDTR